METLEEQVWSAAIDISKLLLLSRDGDAKGMADVLRGLDMHQRTILIFTMVEMMEYVATDDAARAALRTVMGY